MGHHKTPTMTNDENRTPRDPARPTDYYHAFVAREHEAMLAYTNYDNPALFASVAPKCMRIGVALYSAGEDLSESLGWFEKAADYQTRFLVEGVKFNLAGLGIIDTYFELYSAAFLAGKSDELIGALKKCTYKEDQHPMKVRLLDQFCDLLQGRPVETDEAEVAEIGALKKEWAHLPPLFSAAAAQDGDRMPAALEAYLLKYWGPPMEREAKRELRSPNPEYSGKWSLLSAAACRIAGGVPDISKKAMSYVPTDFVTR
jgi:hypothetical protein